jgi:hypothetical protein
MNAEWGLGGRAEAQPEVTRRDGSPVLCQLRQIPTVALWLDIDIDELGSGTEVARRVVEGMAVQVQGCRKVFLVPPH